MGLMDWLFGSKRKRKARTPDGEKPEARARRILNVEEAPDNRIDAMRMLSARRKRKRKARNIAARRSRGQKIHLRTINRYRDRKSQGRAVLAPPREAKGW